MTFKSLNLIKPIIKSISELGYTKPTLVQEMAIPEILNGEDVIISSKTGSGKTAAYTLPLVQKLFDFQDAPKKGKKIKALIICPTRELAIQILQNVKGYAKYSNLRATAIFGGASIAPQVDQLKKGVDIVIATPGRLLDLHKQDLINLDYTETLVLDEADLMLAMGFIDDVKKINHLCTQKKQTLLCSATIPFKIEKLAEEILNSPKRINVTSDNSEMEHINQTLYFVPKRDKIKLSIHLLRNQIKGNTIIFRRTKFGVKKLEEILTEKGYKVDSIHSDKSQSERQTALNKFKSGYIQILIATDVAARGIDIEDLNNVINFDIPNKVDTYVHRIGRTGRAGKSGNAISFCSVEEKNDIHNIEKSLMIQIDVENSHPYILDPNEKVIKHQKKGSKYKKGRKSEASKKKKKRWY